MHTIGLRYKYSEPELTTLGTPIEDLKKVMSTYSHRYIEEEFNTGAIFYWGNMTFITENNCVVEIGYIISSIKELSKVDLYGLNDGKKFDYSALWLLMANANNADIGGDIKRMSYCPHHNQLFDLSEVKPCGNTERCTGELFTGLGNNSEVSERDCEEYEYDIVTTILNEYEVYTYSITYGREVVGLRRASKEKINNILYDI